MPYHAMPCHAGVARKGKIWFSYHSLHVKSRTCYPEHGTNYSAKHPRLGIETARLGIETEEEILRSRSLQHICAATDTNLPNNNVLGGMLLSVVFV